VSRKPGAYQNNHTAHLQVGDEVPIVTQQAQGITDPNAPIVSTLQLRETGVILEVTPRINASDLITLEITQEVSGVTPTTTSGIDSPTIQQRRFTSTVPLKTMEPLHWADLSAKLIPIPKVAFPF